MVVVVKIQIIGMIEEGWRQRKEKKRKEVSTQRDLGPQQGVIKTTIALSTFLLFLHFLDTTR